MESRRMYGQKNNPTPLSFCVSAEQTAWSENGDHTYKEAITNTDPIKYNLKHIVKNFPQKTLASHCA